MTKGFITAYLSFYNVHRVMGLELTYKICRILNI